MAAWVRFCLLLAGAGCVAEALPSPERPTDARRLELARVRGHLSGALALLEARDLSGLTPRQRANRAQLIGILRGYRARGVFPRNEQFPGRLVPFFRDRHGVLCAVGFLLASTGRTEIVDRIARTRNNGYVRELVGEPGLAEWLEENSLTVAEAARIQPAYGGELGGDRGRISTGYGMASGFGLAGSAVGAAVSARLLGNPADRRFAGAITLAVGAGTALLGLTNLDNGGGARTLGLVDAVVGGVAAIVGLDALFGKQPNRRSSRATTMRIAPLVSAGDRPSAGVAVSVRF